MGPQGMAEAQLLQVAPVQPGPQLVVAGEQEFPLGAQLDSASGSS